MSHQISVFADEVDLVRLISDMATVLGERTLIVDSENFSDRKNITKCSSIDILHKCKCYVVPFFALQEFDDKSKNEGMNPSRDFAAIEFKVPKFKDENAIAEVGRFYWSYLAKLSKENTAQIKRFFLQIKIGGVELPIDTRFRIYPNVAKRARLLDYGVGIVKPNPFYSEKIMAKTEPTASK